MKITDQRPKGTHTELKAIANKARSLINQGYASVNIAERYGMTKQRLKEFIHEYGDKLDRTSK